MVLRGMGREKETDVSGNAREEGERKGGSNDGRERTVRVFTEGDCEIFEKGGSV